MAFWALAPMIASMASQAAAGNASAAGSVDAAETQAAIDAMNRRFQMEQFNKEMERSKPYYDMGLSNLPQLQNYMQTGQMSLDDKPLYRMQQREGTNALNSLGLPGQFAQNRFQSALKAGEGERAYDRLLDTQRVGMGGTALAGQSTANYGSALANLGMSTGNALARGAAGQSQALESSYRGIADAVSSLPAAYYLGRSTNYGRV